MRTDARRRPACPPAIGSAHARPCSPASHWIDADIGFAAESALRLLRSGYDIAAGVYPLKREGWPAQGVPQGTTRESFEATYTRYTVNAQPEPGGDVIELKVQPDGFMKMNEAPTGFMCIARSAIERLVAAYPDLQYVPDSIGVPDQGLHYRLFDVMADIDANSNLSHQGSKLYRGDFANSLQTAMPHAVGGPVGMQMLLTGGEYLKANPTPP